MKLDGSAKSSAEASPQERGRISAAFLAGAKAGMNVICDLSTDSKSLHGQLAAYLLDLERAQPSVSPSPGEPPQPLNSGENP
jgi:hypothetical protein